jgi:formate dehydrogenase (coenzyme F420) alpha subunit
MEVVDTTCSMCSSKCGIHVRVAGHKIDQITNMEGHLLNRRCPKSAGIPELLSSPERLTDPLKRSGSGWEKISWDEAFTLIADRLEQVRKQFGPQSLLVTAGYPWNSSHSQSVMKRFTHLYGSPNFTNIGSLCFRARAIAHGLTVGRIISQDYSGEPHCEIIWGKNPDENWPPHGRAVRKMLKNGGKLIVVDPRVIPLAEKAHIHARIRPGTDCALVLGLLHVMIAEGLYDRDFVANWTVGFDRLAEHVKAYSPERVADITRVPADTIRDIARTYAAHKPGVITTGIALDHSTNGIQTLRAVAILVAISGNLDVEGGNKYSPKLKLKNMNVEDAIRHDVTVGDDFPMFIKYVSQPSFVPAIDQMITGKPYPIKAMIIAGANPAVTWPNSAKVIEGLRRVDFKVVIDVFMTETTRMADLVLPGSTFLERGDLRNYFQHYGSTDLVLTRRASEPLGNAKEDWRIWAELGRKMGYGDYFPWQNNDELVEDLLKPNKVRLADLKEHPEGVPYAPREFRQYLKEGFDTPSKKVEIYSESMQKFGYDPLPVFQEPLESPLSRPDLADEYPLTMISYRINAFTGSQYFNLPSARRRVPEPWVEIHPQTAGSRGIAEGDVVKIESIRGCMKIKARITERVPPDVISVPFGWGGDAKANLLTDDMNRDPVSAFPSFKPLCRVTKI